MSVRKASKQWIFVQSAVFTTNNFVQKAGTFYRLLSLDIEQIFNKHSPYQTGSGKTTIISDQDDRISYHTSLISV